jgi:hypothetical protein
MVLSNPSPGREKVDYEVAKHKLKKVKLAVRRRLTKIHHLAASIKGAIHAPIHNVTGDPVGGLWLTSVLVSGIIT